MTFDEMQKQFGSFDLNRILTSFELEHFNEFMKPVNHSVPAKEVSLTKAVDQALADMDQYFR